MSLNSFTLGILVSSLVVSTALGQCPPVPEGSLPESEKIANLILPTKKVINSDAHVPDKLLKPVKLKKKPQVTADVVILASDAMPKQSWKNKVFVGEDVKFPGPISIQVPGAGLNSKIVEQDGRFIIVGASDTFNGQVVEQGLLLARFEADGTPDPSFGQGGSTRIILFAQNNYGNNFSPSVALSPNGKIVVVRSITDRFPGNIPGSRVAVVRMDHDGSLDPTFGNGGLVYTTIDNQFRASSVAVQRDDRVLVGGESGNNGDCRKESCTKFATLVRYQTNGLLDHTFGGLGVTRVRLLVGETPGVLSRESSFSSLFVQENGLIVAAGKIETATDNLVLNTKMLIAEYLPTGELNPAFGSSGVTMLAFDGPYQRFGASSLAFRENGRILVGGTALLYKGSQAESWLVDGAFIFAQLRPSGELDATFGNAGKVVININPLNGPSPSRPLDFLEKVMLAPSGDIYAAGIASGPVGDSESAINFIALKSDGSLNQNFGNAGLYSFGTHSPWHMQLAEDALLTSDGRLVISGTHWPTSLPDAFVLWAYSIKPGLAGCP